MIIEPFPSRARSGSIPLTCGSGSWIPKNMLLRIWIRLRNTEEANVTHVSYLLNLMQAGNHPGRHHSCPTRVCGRYSRRLWTRSAGRASSSNRTSSLPETELQVCQTFSFIFLRLLVVQRPSLHNAHHGTSGSPPPPPWQSSKVQDSKITLDKVYIKVTSKK
jgi:hypothetical protein